MFAPHPSICFTLLLVSPWFLCFYIINPVRPSIAHCKKSIYKSTFVLKNSKLQTWIVFKLQNILQGASSPDLFVIIDLEMKWRREAGFWKLTENKRTLALADWEGQTMPDSGRENPEPEMSTNSWTCCSRKSHYMVNSVAWRYIPVGIGICPFWHASRCSLNHTYFTQF